MPANDGVPSTDSSVEQSTGAVLTESTPPTASTPSKTPGALHEIYLSHQLGMRKARFWLNELKVTEVAMEKRSRVKQLKEAIAEAEKRLSNLVDSPLGSPGPSNTLSTTMLAGTSAGKDMKDNSFPLTPLDAVIAGTRKTQNGHVTLHIDGFHRDVIKF